MPALPDVAGSVGFVPEFVVPVPEPDVEGATDGPADGLALPLPVSVGVGLLVLVGVAVPVLVGVGDADVGDTLGDGDTDRDTEGLAAGEPPGVGHINAVLLGFGWSDGSTPGPAPVGPRTVVAAVEAPEPLCPELPVPDGAQPDVPLAPGTAAAPADDVLAPVAPRVPLDEVPVPFPVRFPEPSVPPPDPFEEFPPVSTVELT